MARISTTLLKPGLLKPGTNCWRSASASHAAVIVDCAPYYRAIYEAVGKARHSIFVVGWDIDSRIELLRGPETSRKAGNTRFFDLIRRKAKETPDLQIYLNRWDYSLYMAGEREGLSKIRWQFFAPDNVHYCLDNVHPFGGCHHQKIVTIDDELAFVGGMDIALGRWDFREHHPRNKNRVDPGGAYQPATKHPFGPHHDIQLMVAGPVVGALAEIVRERWHRATGEEALPINAKRAAKPASWPKHIAPDFTNVPVALSRTLPAMGNRQAVREIERLYLDQIAQAERFIYIENQYLTRLTIARALNRRLREKPELRVVLVSCHEPQGIFERKAMWGGRVAFHDVLMRGDVAGRVAMAYPLSRENGQAEAVRIHSKIMAVDDRFLHIGSANLNNRSMRLDSECDVTILGETAATRKKIAAIRTDLIREHTGMPAAKIEKLIAGDAPAAQFLHYLPGSRQHLQHIDDDQYRDQPFMAFATRIADADRPLLGAGG